MQFMAIVRGTPTPDTCPSWLLFPAALQQGGDSPQLTVHSTTPIHGRSCFATLEDGQTWCVKGVGWSFGPPYFLQSPKDDQLYFGLFDKRSAERELKVSDWLASHGLRTARVAGYVELAAALLERISGGKPLAFKDGTPLFAVQQYTRTIVPYRVADLAYFNDAQRTRALTETAAICGWSKEPDGFVRDFANQLADTVLKYHALDCVNDSLTWDNTTLAAEPIDFEWFSIPEIVLPDGTDPTTILVPRQQKEVIYIGEITVQLAALLGTRITLGEVLGMVHEKLQSTYPQRETIYAPILSAT
jgi:hypothetical protein